MDIDEPEVPDDFADARYRSLLDDLQDMRDEARVYVTTELDFLKARAAYAGRVIAKVALFGLLAAMLLLFAIVALTLGAIIALTPWLGPWGATGAVFGGLLLFAGLFAGLAVWRLKRMSDVIGSRDGGP